MWRQVDPNEADGQVINNQTFILDWVRGRNTTQVRLSEEDEEPPGTYRGETRNFNSKGTNEEIRHR